jgi:hypothetical protein
LLPREVPRHEVAPTPLAMAVKFDVRCGVKFAVEIRVVQHITDYNVGIPIPDLVFLARPIRGIRIRIATSL